MDNESSTLVGKLFDINAVKFGSFKLKSGQTSPVYFDLRVIISYPDVLISVSDLIWKKIQLIREKFSVVCGVPYTALPIATCICASNKVPMVIRRKEAKDYGTKKIIEGHYQQDANCLIIEDVVTSGSSVLETAAALKDAGLTVTDAVVLLDREQGGKYMLESEGITLLSIFTMTEILECLKSKQKITHDTVMEVQKFISNNNTFHGKRTKHAEISKTERDVKVYRNSVSETENHCLTYEERSAICKNKIATEIFRIMHEKKTNLCLSADVDSAVELVEIADILGPHICILKTHVDILDMATPKISHALSQLATKHDFILFEDRKFADIGSTVRKQYTAGTYSISEWAQLTNAHSLPGPGVIEGLKAAVQPRDDRACLLIAQMSSKGNLVTEDYTKATVGMAKENEDFVIGFICTSRVSDDPKFLHLTPGVKLHEGGDQMGQQYLTPDEVIRNRNSDIIIVGRGITLAANRLQAALEYKASGWKAYLDRMSAV